MARADVSGTGGSMSDARLMLVALCGFSMALAACSRHEAASEASQAKAVAPVTTPAPPGCEPDGPLRYLCGPVNAEDLMRIGNTRWLIASGMDGQLMGTDTKGHLYLVDHEAKAWSEWFPGPSPALRHDAAAFKDCPAPLD